MGKTFDIFQLDKVFSPVNISISPTEYLRQPLDAREAEVHHVQRLLLSVARDTCTPLPSKDISSTRRCTISTGSRCRKPSRTRGWLSRYRPPTRPNSQQGYIERLWHFCVHVCKFHIAKSCRMFFSTKYDYVEE